MLKKLKALLGIKNMSEAMIFSADKIKQKPPKIKVEQGMLELHKIESCNTCNMKLNYIEGDTHIVRQTCDVECELIRAKQSFTRYKLRSLPTITTRKGKGL